MIHKYNQTSIHARQSINSSVADIVFENKPMTEDEKREKRRWTDPINDGTQGYIIAWILKLGGYLD